MFVALLGLVLRKDPSVNKVFAILLLLVSLVMVERAYQLLGVERGFIAGVCSMDLGLPSWFAIDKWIPWMFEVKTTCGYTPYVLFKITMA